VLRFRAKASGVFFYLFGGFGFIIYFCTCRKKKQQALLELPVLKLKALGVFLLSLWYVYISLFQNLVIEENGCRYDGLAPQRLSASPHHLIISFFNIDVGLITPLLIPLSQIPLSRYTPQSFTPQSFTPQSLRDSSPKAGEQLF